MSHSTTRRRGLAVVLCATVAAVAPMGAARAETKGHTDPAADMVEYAYGSEGDTSDPAPAQTNADITSWTVTHSTGSVTVRAHFTDLSKTADQQLQLAGTIRTETGLERFWNIEASDGHWRGLRSFSTPKGKPVHCTSSHSLDYSTDTLVIKMARSCFGKPTWVKAQLVSAATDSDRNTFLDDGLSASDDLTKRTGRVHRG